MERYDFKGDFTNSVFRLMKNIYFPSTVFSTVLIIVIALIAFLLFSNIGDTISEIQGIFSDTDDPMAAQAEYQAFIGEFFMNNLILIIPLLLANLLIGAFMYNGLFSIASSEVKEHESNIQTGFNGMTNKNVIQVFILLAIITIAYQLLNYLSSSSGSGLIAFLFLLIVAPIYYWLQLSYAYASIGNRSFLESLKQAQSQMTIARLAKVLGIGILVILVFMVIALIVGLVLALFSFIPILSAVVGVIFIIGLLGLMISFVISGYSGLFFRYTDDQNPEEEFLVTD